MGKASSAAATETTQSITSSRTTTTTTTGTPAIASAGMMKRKKKKGRPSLLDLQKRQQQQQQQQQRQQQKQDQATNNNNKTLTPPPNYNSTRRSTRRNPNPLSYDSPASSFDDDDDDDERQQKKVKLVVRLPPSSSEQHHQFSPDSPSRNSPPSSSASDSDPDHAQEREINALDHRSNHAAPNQGKRGVKATDTVHGSSLESGGPTTPLPDKTMLVFVLDRLQKKDTYGVFSEPVDPNELPDYHEIIEHPMDFGTVRKKLDGGIYTNLEELEADVMLICSNAMQYNSSDTVYFRQARSIQELAKRDFENLRNEGDNGEPQPKIVRRGRPPSKNLKKPIESSPADRVGLEVSSGATLATTPGEDKTGGSNGYNLRKGPMLYKFRSNDAAGTSFRSRNGENYSDWLVDWNSEFPASILRADMKYGKKHFSVDENRRDTYKQFDSTTSSSKHSYFSNGFGDMKRLLAVGLHMDSHAYARSLARYAANLGPVAWNVACRKLKSVLPDGLAFGPGWVEENDAPLPFLPERFKLMNGLVSNHEYASSRQANPSAPDLGSAVQRPSGETVEARRRLNCQNELGEQGGHVPWTVPPGTPFQIPQKTLFHPSRNGLNGMFGFDLVSSQMVGMGARPSHQAGPGSGLEDGSIATNQMQQVGRLCAGDISSLHPGVPRLVGVSEERKGSDNWGITSQSGKLLSQVPDSQLVSEAAGQSSSQVLAAQQRRQTPGVAPDLNIRVQATGSPSSSLQIGSPQPDLALQL